MIKKRTKKHRAAPIDHDEWGRPVLYLAQYTGATGGGSTCLFTNLDAAIFFVVTGLGNDIDWSNFPDPTRKYPYEERNGNERPHLSPSFRVERTGIYGKPAHATVMKMAAMEEWSVGNGIAEMGRRLFRAITGRDEVVFSGKGDAISARVKGRK